MATYEYKGKLMKRNYKKKKKIHFYKIHERSFKNVPYKSILRLNSKISAKIENFSKFPNFSRG